MDGEFPTNQMWQNVESGREKKREKDEHEGAAVVEKATKK